VKELKTILRPHYGKIALAPLFKLIEAMFELLIPLIVAQIINVGIATGDVPFILWRGAWLLGLAVAGILCALVGQYVAAQMAAQVGRTLRSRLWAHVMRLSHEQAGDVGAGRLMNLVSSDAMQVQGGLNLLVRLGLRVPFLAVGGVVMSLLLNPAIGLVFLGSVALLGVILFFLIRYLLPAFGRVQGSQDELTRLARENLAGARVIRAFHRQKSEEDVFSDAATDLTRVTVRVGRIAALMNPVSGLLINLAVFVTLYLGARHTYQDLSNPGEIVALVSYMTTTLLAIAVAVHLVLICTRAAASAKRIEAVLALEPAVTDGIGADPKPNTPTLHFDHVTFTYHHSARPALADVSFTLHSGQTLGIIGGTGSGKSTLANLILRFMDAQTGTVEVGGVPIQDYTLRALRGQMGFAPQKAALFSGTVAENLRMAYPSATDADLWDTLRVAQAEDFVGEMPQGLNSVIEQGGRNLSGGQRQRLGIARALVGRPGILLLDDVFSSLDYLTEHTLGQALRTWARDTAVVLISQRGASVRHADQILVLEDGGVAGLGTHQDLLKSCTIYQEICRSQGLEEGVD